jgi:translation initiation factor 5B
MDTTSRPKVPICSIIGHVDVGKTKLLDLMRASSTEEASGITQQIGATLYSREKLEELSGNLKKYIDCDGMLMIDTPGHECFTAIRYVGMMVSDIVIILIDVHKGIEAETKRCLEYLSKNNKKIIFAVNKIDRLYGWKKDDTLRFSAVKKLIKKQEKNTLDHLDKQINMIKCQLAECEVNAELYYKNTDSKIFSNIVPISAMTGEGLPDLIALISKMYKGKMLDDSTYGFVLDDREDSKYGKYHVCVHKNGTISKGDKLMSTDSELTVKKILVTKKDEKEIKDSHKFKIVDSLSTPCGCGLVFEEDTHLEPGSVYSTNKTDLKAYETDDLDPYVSEIGLTVVAPSRILMDALVKSLDKENIKMSLMKVGKIDKLTIIMSGKWVDNSHDAFGKLYNVRYNTILHFDPSNLEEKSDSINIQYAKDCKVKIIVGNTIYKLIDKYNKYIKELNGRLMPKYPDVFNDVSLKIIPKYVFMKRSPLLFGVTITKGKIMLGTTIKVKEEISEDGATHDKLLGKIVSIRLNDKDVKEADAGNDVCIKIDNPHKFEYDNHFGPESELVNVVGESDMSIRYTYNINY